MFEWTEAHNKFSSTLYALLASQGVISSSGARSSSILVSNQFNGNGAQVMQDLLCLHHPRHNLTQVPAFLSVKGSVPIMSMNVAAGEQLSGLSRYFQAFSNWEDHLKLYPDARYLHETEYHILFIHGLTPVLRNFVMTERHDLMVFQGKIDPISPSSRLQSRCTHEVFLIA